MAPEAHALGQALDRHLTRNRPQDPTVTHEIQASHPHNLLARAMWQLLTTSLAVVLGTGMTSKLGPQASPGAVLHAAC